MVVIETGRPYDMDGSVYCGTVITVPYRRFRKKTAPVMKTGAVDRLVVRGLGGYPTWSAWAVPHALRG